ncbi:hypothetical protein [Cohnella sp. AR92]|uniref:hypothetical protein n=1 Tax=Cohnella sp. AR92 TaxID=648716 RepID=UPI000F8DA80D|nr:hypothetical protein [Cohnella sp. AR92]RUS42276.1 hypothetical protein ELR57_27065 [Cohnella sp. AR92]
MGKWGGNGEYIDYRMELASKASQQLIGHNAVAIRNTSPNDVDVDVLQIPGLKALIISNTTDQQATVIIYAKASNYSFAGMGGSKTVNAGSAFMFSDADFTGLRMPLQKLTVRVSFATAPTSGSVSSFIEGCV